MSKKCNKCEEVKALTDFHKQTNAKDGHVYMCKVCVSAKGRAWVKANPEKQAARRKSWYKANIKRLVANSEAWLKANPDYCKACTKCGEVKALDKFCKNKMALDGHQYICKVCNIANSKTYYQANTEKEIARQKAWCESYPERHAARNRKWNKANPEKHRANVKAWQEANRGKLTEYAVKRMAAKLERTVSWADRKKIAEFYTEAKRLEKATGIVMHVDHIIPLRGKLVSGLHVETNLQILTWHDNLCKSNKFNTNN